MGKKAGKAYKNFYNYSHVVGKPKKRGVLRSKREKKSRNIYILSGTNIKVL